MNQTRRKILFVKKDFQKSFIIKFSLIVIISSLIFGAILFFLSFGSTTIVLKDLRVQTLPTYKYLLPSITVGLFFSLLLASIIAIILCLIYSHRIGGPMYRFEKVLDDLAKGDLKQSAKIRKKDELQDISASLDNAINSLHENISNLKNSCESLIGKINKTDPSVSENIKEIQENFNRFKL